ncbi:hypothetical protein RRG08_020907 [Elysia crispata]|uniref:Uncharacterized protein n=1 Tax=Elysia crispata TaxID=231223 RepID=A0AAE1DXC1_9GAST|nr:hypothetical protein RRG08_020907 [Elysia crispata]
MVHRFICCSHLRPFKFPHAIGRVELFHIARQSDVELTDYFTKVRPEQFTGNETPVSTQSVTLGPGGAGKTLNSRFVFVGSRLEKTSTATVVKS